MGSNILGWEGSFSWLGKAALAFATSWGQPQRWLWGVLGSHLWCIRPALLTQASWVCLRWPDTITPISLLEDLSWAYMVLSVSWRVFPGCECCFLVVRLWAQGWLDFIDYNQWQGEREEIAIVNHWERVQLPEVELERDCYMYFINPLGTVELQASN